ncbi:MAG: hypothetical protein WBE58_10945 [Verrucomicrobiales bacterium]|nr:hypothetical protein [Verrucomicrobiales bacterium]
MKSIFVPIFLCFFFLAGAIAGTPPKHGKKKKEQTTSIQETIDAHPKLLRITATFDGSGRFQFTRETLTYDHKQWSRPTEVSIDGEPWNDLTVTPGPWNDISHHIDLSKAWIVKREGRDTVALESTPDGFDLYVADSPNGAAEYSIVIAIPRLP